MDIRSNEDQSTYYKEEPIQLFVDLNPFDFLEGDEHLTVDLSCKHFRDSLSKKYEWLEYDANQNYVSCKYCKTSTYGQKIAILSHRLACVRLDVLHNHSMSSVHSRSRTDTLNKICNNLSKFDSESKDGEFLHQSSHPVFNNEINPLNSKGPRRRNYQQHWENSFPWLKFDTDKQCMYCKYCRDFPHFADLTSSFYLFGSKVFRLDVIRKHNDSLAHQRCAQASEAMTFSDITSIKNEKVQFRSNVAPTFFMPSKSSPSKVRQRNRHYLKHWEDHFPWLYYDETKKLMFCTFCLQFPDIPICKETPFFKGSCSFRMDSLRKHEWCKAHVQAVVARRDQMDMNA